MNKFQNSKIQPTPGIIILKPNRKTETITCFCVLVSLKRNYPKNQEITNSFSLSVILLIKGKTTFLIFPLVITKSH